MAEPILRLRVESKEYDSKIKRAADGLLELENSCRKTQKSMADADKATVDYVRQIGRMETVNRTAKGSVNELQKTFVELSAQYNRLTEQEKRSPFGQALAKSIDDLKGRVQQGRQELDRINQSLNGTSSSGNKATGVLDSLAGKFGLNAQQLVSFAGKLGVAKVALDVARDAFMASEANMDEWGAVVRSAQDVYQGFLNALNTSDISGFLGRINDIIAAARAAYDALDTLETAKIINSPRKSAKQAEIDRMRTMLQTGRYIAPNGQKPIMKEGTKLTEQQLANISKNLQSAVGNLNDITRSEIQLANTAIDRLYDEQAKVIGMSKQQFMAGTADMTTFSRNVEMGKRYKEFEAQHTSYGSQGSIVGHRDKAVNPYAAYRGWAEFSEGGKLYQGIVGLITQRDQQLSQMYSSIGSNYRRINAIQGFSPTGGRGGGGHTGGGVGGGTTIEKTEMQLNSEQIGKLNQEYISATAERREAIRGEIKTLQERNAEIQKLIDESNGKVEDKAIVGSVRDLNEQMAKLKKQQQDVTDNGGWKKLQGEMDGLQKRINGIMGVVEPDMSIFSNKNLQALTSSLKQQLDESNIGSELYDKLTGQLFDATAFGNLLSEFVKNGIDMSEIDAAGMWKKIFGGEDVATEELQKMLDTLNAYLAEHGLDLMQVNQDGSLGNVEKKDKKDPVDQVSKAVSGLSTIASGIQQTGVKLPPAITDAINVMQGVISVVQGVQTIISLFSNTTTTANTAALFANTAALGTLTTVMLANTATNAIPFLAHGGIVHAATGLVAGHDFSDNTPVMVSSGELILNKAQQGNLAAQLDGGNGIGDLHLETKVSAEEFRVMLNSNSRRRGRGEYVTTRG